MQSIGDSTFKALTLQASKRLAQGLTFNVQYVAGKGLDNTPLLTQLTVQAEQGRSDPSNLDRDKGPNPLDMRHNLTGNIVYTSRNQSSNAVVRALLDGNQIGVLLQFNSGLPVNIRLERRPERRRRRQRSAALRRPQLALSAEPLERRPALHALDPDPRVGARRGHRRDEERVQHRADVAASTRVVTTDAAGNPATPIPDGPVQVPERRPGYEQRKFQLGFKVRF